MGLFDSLKKNLGNISKEAEKYKDEIQKGIEKFAAEQNLRQSQPAQQAEPVKEADYPAPVRAEEAVDQFPKFDDIITRNFSDWEVKRNLPASALMSDCHPACTPVQFMFYKDSEPVLAVVLVKTNNYKGMNVLGTKRICDAKNIPYLRFYHEFDNNESYVVDRIRKHL